MDLTRALATGYRLPTLTAHPRLSRETPAYSATLTHEGRAVAEVTSDGGGGAPLALFRAPGDRAAFEQTARTLAAAQDVPGYLPPEEELISVLHLHATLAQDVTKEARTHLVIQLPEDGDFWEGGSYRAIPLRGMRRADVLDVVRERYPEVRIWDTTTATFQTPIL